MAESPSAGNNWSGKGCATVWPPTVVQLQEFCMTDFDLILCTIDAFNSVQ